MYPTPRELPVGARQWAAHRHIPSERRTEISRLRRVRPLQRIRVLPYGRTRVVPQRYIAPLSLIIGTKAIFFVTKTFTQR